MAGGKVKASDGAGTCDHARSSFSAESLQGLDRKVQDGFGKS